MAAEAFYEQLDEHRWRATAATTGPWAQTDQHAGPPAALLGTVLADSLGEGRIVRCTFEILRPVPVADLTTTVEILRPGRRVTMGRVTLSGDAGPVMSVQGWRLREADSPLPADRPGGDVDMPRMPAPEGCEPGVFFGVDWDEGYHTSVDIRFARGAFLEPGDGAAWIRSRLPLVAGTELTPLQRLLIAADTGNAVSARLDLDWLFVNTDLTVHVHELPEGEWIGLDAATRYGPGGIGQATSQLHGAQGPIGWAHQSLVVEPR